MAYPNLAAEMKRFGISQEEMASRIGTTPETVSRWLNGRNKMPVEACFRVKQALFPNLSIDYLFSDTPTSS
jgi:transcriptional regulator with XRE-family HTH domain